MEKIFFYILCLAGTALLFGCDDFLTKDPESSYVVSGSYKTQDDFKFAIAGAYATQQDMYGGNVSALRLIIARSDDVRNDAPYTYGASQFTDNETNQEIEGKFYRPLWVIINRCNMILDKIDGVEFKDHTVKDNIKGEAYTLRGWAYYMLGIHFGGMPLIDHVISVTETLEKARSSQDETLDFATSDLQQGIQLLPEAWTGADLGRVNKYGAEGILARLYLFRSNFPSAKPLLKDIIDSGRYEMEEEYVNCFTDSHDNGSERVWEAQFTGGQLGEGQTFTSNCLPEGYEGDLMPFSGFSSAMKVSLDMVDAYEEGDLRKDVSTVTNIMVKGVVEQKYHYICKFSHYEAYTPKAQSDWATNLPILRYTDVLMMYAECLNEEGYVADGEAFSIINKVRARAGLQPLTSSTVPNKDSFRNALIHERRVEFAFEGLRWFDLVRWGIVKETMNAHFMTEDEGNGRYSMKDYQTIFAIPANEMSRYNNKDVMWQNPGY